MKTPTENYESAASETVKFYGLLAGVAAILVVALAPPPPGLTSSSWAVAGVATFMMIWWMTEAVPLPATALAPLVLLPPLGVAKLATVAHAYAHPLIFLFLGGFLIAKALERWNLHRRIASAMIRLGARGPITLIGSLMAATAFLSMWISNTATAIVMIPIAQSIMRCIHQEGDAPSAAHKAFGAALMLGIAFSATIGGMATLIGTPPNALLAGYLETNHNISIGFGQWMLLGLPIVATLLPITWLLLTRLVFKPAHHDAIPIRGVLPNLAPKDQKMPRAAKLTAAVAIFAGTAILFRPFAEMLLPNLPLSDAGIAITAAFILFALPAGEDTRENLLGWREAQAIRWDVLILFGGGLALASAIDSSGLSRSIGAAFTALDALPVTLLVLIAMAVIVYLGELASNTAMAAVFLPVAGAAAVGLGTPALDLVIPIGLAASLGFMLPVATPPNAIAYGTGDVTSRQMLKTGAILDVIGIAVVYAVAMSLAPLIFTK